MKESISMGQIQATGNYPDAVPAKILGVGGKLLLLHPRVPTALFLDERKTGPSTTRLFLKRTQNWEIDEDTWPFIFAVRTKQK